jgi:hypothetical protein
MSNRTFGYLLFVVLASVATDASAARRGTRIDGFSGFWSNQLAMGSPDCPGTTAGAAAADTLVQRLGFTFSGRENAAHTAFTYCQTASPGALTQTNYTYPDEADLASLFGNDPNAVSGIRYGFFDDDPFGGTPTGFQWAFYTFPNGVTVASLYGFETQVLDATSYINGPVSVWSGTSGYDGEYFCFRPNQYIGAWNGLLSDTTSPCLQALQAPAAPGALQFSAATYSVGEGAGTATITVTRTGGSDGVVGVTYATADGTAAAGSDYTATTGTLSWNAGDAAAKSFTVAITNDTAPESNETVALALSAATGGATLGAPASATLTILDDDAPVGGGGATAAPTMGEFARWLLIVLLAICAMLVVRRRAH